MAGLPRPRRLFAEGSRAARVAHVAESVGSFGGTGAAATDSEPAYGAFGGVSGVLSRSWSRGQAKISDLRGVEGAVTRRRPESAAVPGWQVEAHPSSSPSSGEKGYGEA